MVRPPRFFRAAGLLLLLACGASARGPRAEVRVHGLFGDGMVLQRDRPCPVWGTAAPGETVSVSLLEQSKTATVGPDGRWSVTLDPMPAGGPHELRVNDRTIHDVLIGEVWLASGDGNMNMPLKSAQIGSTEPDDNPIPMIRFFVVPRRQPIEPERDVQGSWRSNRSDTVQDVSAVAYFFSRELQRRLKVPVGILQTTADDSFSFMWASDRAIRAEPALGRNSFYQRMTLENFKVTHDIWERKVRKAEEARKRGEAAPPVPPEPVNTYALSGLYNGMIAPLIPFALRGAILYHGESE